jgi:CheY-like chemotaxis protein
MARILISEPHELVRRLLEQMLMRMGHEPFVVTVPTLPRVLDADLFIVEPAAPVGIMLVQAVHIANPSLSMICASVYGPPGELHELGVVFADCLIKPFTLDQLQAAIEFTLHAQSV